MAARSPRRSFATPFVVTLAIAPACHRSGPDPGTAPNPPPPEVTSPPAVVDPPRPDPDPSTALPEKPKPEPHWNPPKPASPDPATKWVVRRTKDGCMVTTSIRDKKSVEKPL